MPESQFIVHSGDMTEDPNIEQQWKWFFQFSKALKGSHTCQQQVIMSK